MAIKRVGHAIVADMIMERRVEDGRAVVEGADPVSGIGFRYRARDDHITLTTGQVIDLRDEDDFAFLPCARQYVARVVARWIRADENLP